MTEAVAAERRLIIDWEDPKVGLARAKGMDGLGFLKAMLRGELPPPPMARLLGFDLAMAEPGGAAFTVEPGEHHYNPMATVHGGLIATLCDSAMGCAVLSTCAEGQLFTTLDLSLSFVKAVTAATGRLRAEATILHRGGRIATAECKVVDAAGKLYAHATTTCMILEGAR